MAFNEEVLLRRPFYKSARFRSQQPAMMAGFYL